MRWFGFSRVAAGGSPKKVCAGYKALCVCAAGFERMNPVPLLAIPRRQLIIEPADIAARKKTIVERMQVEAFSEQN